MTAELKEVARKLAAYPYGAGDAPSNVAETRAAFEMRIIASFEEVLLRLITILEAEKSVDDAGNAPDPGFVRGILYAQGVIKSMVP